jgi:hypothetical protein
MNDIATAWRPHEPGIEKRFWLVEDGGVEWSIVANDRDHAIALLRDLGAEWEIWDSGTRSVSVVGIDRALAMDEAWIRELEPEEVARRQRCHTEDERGVIPLAEAAIGDLFCSEW